MGDRTPYYYQIFALEQIGHFFSNRIKQNRQQIFIRGPYPQIKPCGSYHQLDINLQKVNRNGKNVSLIDI